MQRTKKTRRPKQARRATQAKQAKRPRQATQAKQAKGPRQTTEARRAKHKVSPRRSVRDREPRWRRVETDDFLTHSIEPAVGAAPGGPSEGERSLGERIREAREMRGLTLEDLSSRSGISVDTLERVESNQAIPPLGELIRLGKALQMKMGYFISEGVDSPVCVVRSESRRRVARHGKKMSERYGYVYESLAAGKANRLMEPFLVNLTPTEFGELSRHDGQEFIFVLEGEVRAQVGKEVEVLKAGDAIYYDSSNPHLVKTYGKKPAKILAVINAGVK